MADVRAGVDALDEAASRSAHLDDLARDEYELLARLAIGYYEHGLTQEALGRTFALSRPKVQRLLDRARAVVITCNRDDTATLATLSSAQIGLLTTSQLGALSSDQLQALSSGQLNALTSAQIQGLADIECLIPDGG